MHIRLEILLGGALGVAKFRYCCDAYADDGASERTYSETLLIPAGGTFAIPNTGITITFLATPVTFVAGDVYEIDVRCAAWNATDLAEAFLSLASSPSPWRFIAAITSNNNGDAAAHAVLGAALQAQLTTLANSSKYRRGMMPADQTDTAAAAVTAYASTIATRCLFAHGKVKRATVKPFPGFATPVTHSIDVFAARAAGSLPSTDLKRVRSGALEEVTKLFHDEYRTPTSLDDAKISTLRTFENFPGYYITQARLKSQAGSDFKLWPLGLVMDIACETVNRGLVKEVGRGVRFGTVVINGVSYPGAIDERDASGIEEEIAKLLVAQLATPLNAEGFAGYVTALRYRINRTHNVLATGVLIGEVGIKPLAYIDYATTTLGFVVDLPALLAA